ncbi:MAG TPA: hypothetical protein VKG44_00880, partial [Candidatus Baltobacteraceae bacterium]|nr:hypothetical protein [Candidatus Baltobacteraceae bacterium]
SAESKQGAKPAEDVPANAWRQKIDPDPVYLFRFSALTFNSHRIHYDRRYTMEEENYPGLIVHGPLQAMLLTLLVRRNLPHAEIKEFAFRSRRAIFDGAPFSCVGWRSEQDPRQVELSTRDADGNVCMSANATLR